MIIVARRSVIRLCRSRFFSRIVSGLERLRDRRSNLLRVLTYHRVSESSEQSGLEPAMISTSPAAFDEQMQFIAGAAHPVSLQEVIRAIDGAGTLPPKSVLVTFV